MADSYTEGLRRAAPQWSLAGDKQLLDVLQGLHQKIIQKCQETNRNLENMVSALDEASIHLQNVNNKFTALSNSQFIESRVFDDDTDDLTETEKPKIEAETKPDEMASIKQSLQILESLHESVTIMCDSDSESGTDDDDDITRVVLKPKDLYADRPLPYIIGSKLWKTKWHAGLVADDSNSVSSGSMKQVDNLEQYSDSDEPRTESPRHSPTHSSQLSLSSEIESEQLPQSISIPKPTTFPRELRSQSDVAAELARRLGAAEHKLPAPEPIPEAPSPTVRKLYKPDRPTPGTVFLDEPPPLDSDRSEESDGDIFAELHKKQPYTHGNKVESSVADDLFGRPVFNETPPPVNPPSKQKQTLFEDESEPELFADKPKTAPEPRKEDDTGIKKPIGGKSLFGSNATAESIGAAILKRNQRQSSTSGEESDLEPPQIIKKVNEPKNKIIEDNMRERQKDNEVRSQKEKERDIFDDLFAKSERINKEKNKNKVVEQKKEPQKPAKKPDLFSDNIFDDIDDIFTTNIKVVTKDEKKAQKSIFDDDDLFSDISKNVNDNKIKQSESKNTKDLFDDNNDDIFSNKSTEPKKVSKDFKENSVKETKSIFDDSDDDLFADVDKNKSTKNVTMSVNVTKNETVNNLLSSTETRNSEKSLFSDDDDLFKNKNSERESQSIKEKSPVIKTTENKFNIDTSTKQPSKIIKSPDLFEDDDDDGLFLFQSQNKTVSKENTDNKMKDENILPEKLERQIKTSDFKLKTSEDVISEVEPAISVSGDEVTSDEFSKPASTNNDDSSTFTDSEASNINKSNVVGAIDSFVDDNNIVVTKCDKTIDTTVTVAKPNISEKPVITNVTIINTQVKPSTESLSPQDVTATDTTVIDTQVTNVPQITNNTVTSANITVNESEVIVRPNIFQKPSTTKSTGDLEKSLSKKTNSSDLLDNMKDFDANKNVTDSIFDDEMKTDNKLLIETKDVFSDIFNDQPPVFEKPKEPKKSKNVNALFDDDSDDESLFFKKNDVITDERPEGFVSTDARLFGLFRDEPPAIDVDFVQKPNKSDRLLKENVRQNIHSDTSSQEIEKNISKPDVIDGKVNIPADDIFGKEKKSTQKQNIDSDDIFASPYSKPASVKNVKLSDENSNKEDSFSTNVTDDIFKKLSVQDDVDILSSPTTDADQKLLNSKAEAEITCQEKRFSEGTDKDKVEPKKIGKLKPINLNINVNSLLPGALPKKIVKTSDKTDGQAPSKSTEELSSSDSAKDNEFETKLVKSISFEGNPGSPVLDNKLSKERAKIQVKRRPSTRRARREAVKKSGIDFGEDSTDNSSSIDDHPKNKDFDQNEKSVKDKVPYEEQKKSTIQNNEEIVTKDKNTHIKDDSEENPYKELKSSNKTESENYVEHKDTTETFKDRAISPETKKNTNEQKDVKSKIVYILNDEDIFDAKVSKIPEIANPPASSKSIKTENSFDDSDDDIFRAKGSKATEIARPVPTHTENIKTDCISVDPADIFDAKVSTVPEITKPRPIPTENIKPDVIFVDSHDSFHAKDGEKTEISKPDPLPTENVKTKSIFDDSDNIFDANVGSKQPEIAKSRPSTTENIKCESAFDGPDDLIKTKASNENTKVEIKTLGQLYNEPIVKTQKLDFLSDSDDDNLFKPTQATKEVIPVQKKVKTEENIHVVVKDVPLKSKSKTSLFDDSNDDLFKGKTKEVVKNEKKVSLFGSDSDEELFGGSKKEKVVPKKDEFKKEEIKREYKKGSLFADDDDDDLFGASTKKKMDSNPQSSKSTTIKEIGGKTSKPVFEDPLSLLGSDDES